MFFIKKAVRIGEMPVAEECTKVVAGRFYAQARWGATKGPRVRSIQGRARRYARSSLFGWVKESAAQAHRDQPDIAVVQGKPDIVVEATALVDEIDRSGLRHGGATVASSSAPKGGGGPPEIVGGTVWTGFSHFRDSYRVLTRTGDKYDYEFRDPPEAKEFWPGGNPEYARIARDLAQVSTWSEAPMERNKFGYQPDGTFIPEPEEPKAPSSTELAQTRLQKARERAVEIRSIFSQQAALPKGERMAKSLLLEMRAELRRLEQEGA